MPRHSGNGIFFKRSGHALAAAADWKQLVVQRECTSACWVSDCLKLNLNLVVLMDCEPTSASSITSCLRSSENENADSPADYYSDFPAPHAYRGCRAEIRYRAGVPVRNRLEGGAE